MAQSYGFWLKVGVAVAFAVLADVLIYRAPAPGLGLAILAGSLLLGLAVAMPAIRRNRLSLAALGVAVFAAAVQVERPSVVALALFVTAVGVAVLAPAAPARQHAGIWALRLLCAVRGLIGPLLDGRKVSRVVAKRAPIRLGKFATAAILPVVGGLVFLGLFVAANPLLSEALTWFETPAVDIPQVLFVLAAAAVAWTALRPRGWRFKRVPGAPKPVAARASLGSVTAALIVFNLLFALENGLDIAFLWSGAALPEGMTHAEYAHRGAYPLIATALLAGLFVLAFLHPDTPTGQSKRVRRLVTLWVAQNIFLVASTMLRTAAYIEAYSLTRLRIAALLWMALVALGLILIAWRLLAARSAGWLINANVAAVGVVLAGCAVVDLGSIAAGWNVRHAKEVIGTGLALDVCYFDELGGAGLVALAELEQRPLSPEMLDRVRWKRQAIRSELVKQQADWRSWRWRDARRLDRDAGLASASPAFRLVPRSCDGRLPVLPVKLTPPAKP